VLSVDAPAARLGEPWDDRPVTRLAGFLGGLLGLLLVVVPSVAAGGFSPTPPSLSIILTGWRFDPTIALPLAAAAVAWLWIVDRIDRSHPDNPVPIPRTLSFLLGLFAIAFALQSGIELYDTTLLSIHMVQHLLLTMVGPPLILLGAPVTQLFRAASPRGRRVILRVLHSPPIVFLTHPVTAWLSFTIAMWGSHFSPLFELSLEDPSVHVLEHVMYLVTALLFWYPVIGADPAPHRLPYPARGLYLLLQMAPSSFLAMALLFADAPLYRHYATLGSPYGIDALSDQQAAAAIMWIATDMMFIGAILLVVGAWMRAEEARTAVIDRQADLERAAIDARADRLAGRAPSVARPPVAREGITRRPATRPAVGQATATAAGPQAEAAPGISEASSSR